MISEMYIDLIVLTNRLKQRNIVHTVRKKKIAN